jgi:hypothetical protein
LLSAYLPSQLDSRAQTAVDIFEKVLTVRTLPCGKCHSFAAEMSSQTIENQNNRDGKIKDLLKTIQETYSFVIDTREILSQNVISENQEKVCRGILEQTVECGRFIHSYASRSHG